MSLEDSVFIVEYSQERRSQKGKVDVITQMTLTTTLVTLMRWTMGSSIGQTASKWRKLCLYMGKYLSIDATIIRMSAK